MTHRILKSPSRCYWGRSSTVSCACLPYLIVGIQPNLTFYETRHLLLFGLPGALLVLAFKRLVQSAIGDRTALVGVFRSRRGLCRSRHSGTVICSCNSSGAGGLVQPSRGDPYARRDRVRFGGWLQNYSPRFAPSKSPRSPACCGWPGALTRFSASAARRAADYPAGNGIRRNVEGSAFSNMDPCRPQATIEPGPAAAPRRLSRHYYACRLLRRCDVAEFLAQLANVKIDVGPIAAYCRRRFKINLFSPADTYDLIRQCCSVARQGAISSTESSPEASGLVPCMMLVTNASACRGNRLSPPSGSFCLTIVFQDDTCFSTIRRRAAVVRS